MLFVVTALYDAEVGARALSSHVPRFYVGTSGWSYDDWGQGRFYPPGLPRNQWLAHYAQRFDTVEINASFYRLPSVEVVQRWRRMTGRTFRFAVKLWRLITHRKRLVDCLDALGDFFEVVDHFSAKRGPLLVQLPPSQRCDLQRLDRFLADLKRVMGRKPWRVAVEFRSGDWLCEAAYRLLDGYGAAVCLADMPACPIDQPNDAPFVYVRRHGPGGGYSGCYSEQHLRSDADHIKRWLRSGRDVYAYFNNDVGGYAVDNASTLRQLVGSPGTP